MKDISRSTQRRSRWQRLLSWDSPILLPSHWNEASFVRRDRQLFSLLMVRNPLYDLHLKSNWNIPGKYIWGNCNDSKLRVLILYFLGCADIQGQYLTTKSYLVLEIHATDLSNIEYKKLNYVVINEKIVINKLVLIIMTLSKWK